MKGNIFNPINQLAFSIKFNSIVSLKITHEHPLKLSVSS